MKPTTTNHQSARREPGSAWSRRAPTQRRNQLTNVRPTISSRSARRLAARSTEPRSAQPPEGLSLSNAGCRARMLTLMPAGAQPSDRWGCRVSRLHFNPSSNGASLGRRRGHRAAFTGYRTSSSAALSLRARATKHPSRSNVGSAFQPPGLSDAPRARPSAPQRKSMPLRGQLLDAPLTRPRRLRGATEARCVGAPYGQSAGQHSSPDGHLADSAASATPPPTATSAAPLPAHKTRASTRGG